MLLSFSASKIKTALSREIYESATTILNKSPHELTLDDFKSILAKFESSFDNQFEILQNQIENIPQKGKKLQTLLRIKDLIGNSDCFKIALETNALLDKFVAYLAANNFSSHHVIIAEMFTMICSFLEKIEDTPLAGTLLHQRILVKAHSLSSNLCFCLTDQADNLHQVNRQEAKVLYEKAIIYGELCLDYQNSFAEFPLDTSNNRVIQMTTESLGFLAKCYIKKGQLVLAMETLLDTHSHLVKFNIAQTANIILILNVCQNLYRAIFDMIMENNYNFDLLTILQPVLHLTQRYFKIFEEHKIDPRVYNAVSYAQTKQKLTEDIFAALENYYIIIQAEVIQNTEVIGNTVIVTLPQSMPKQQIEKEILALKMVANKPRNYTWLSEINSFMIDNLLFIDLVSLEHFNVRLEELRSKFTLNEERRLLQQFENQKKRQIHEKEVAVDGASSVPAVSAPIPTPVSQVETNLVKSVANLSLKPKKHKNKKRAALPAPSSLIAIPAPIIKYGKDFGYNDPPFADARCAHLRKGVYVLYSPGQFHKDPACDDTLQARFEALAAAPAEARKVSSNGFKMWPVRSASGEHTFTIEGKLTTTALRLLPSTSCTNAKGERAYYFDTIKNTKKGKRENRYKA